MNGSKSSAPSEEVFVTPPPDPLPAHREGEITSVPIVASAEPGYEPSPDVMQKPGRRRSLRMQIRYVRSLIFAARLFARVLFWYYLMPKVIGQATVDRGSNARWVKYAREFRGFAIIMGGVMIKLGQFISTRVDVLPEEITAELAGLQDEVPSVPHDQIRAVLEKELGDVPARFKWMADEPIAAASLGQVYRAQLSNGDRVVVKVQRPGIRDIVYTDLAALGIVAWAANRFTFIRRRADMTALIREFGRVLLEEISYKHEARNAVRFAEMYKADMGIYVPTIYSEHSTDSVLVMEDVTTIKIGDYAAMEAAGISRKAVARRLMDTYLHQVFEERYFHADPHPGNLFVYPLPYENGKRGERPFYLIFVDFGMTATLTPQLASGLMNTLTAIVNRDAEKLVKSYGELGFLLPDADTERIVEATEATFNQVWGLSMSEIKNISYSEARNLGHEFNDLLYSMPFQVPQDFIYLGRTMGILSGMATALDSEFNAWKELLPFAQKMMAQTFRESSAQFDDATGTSIVQSLFNGNGGQALVEVGKLFVSRAAAIPQRLDNVLGQLDRGELTVKVTPAPAYRKQLQRIETQGRRTTRAVIFAGLLMSSTLLYTHGDTAPSVVGFALSGILLLSIWWAGE